MIKKRVPEINMNTHVYCDIQVMPARKGRKRKAAGSRPVRKQHQWEGDPCRDKWDTMNNRTGHYDKYTKLNRHMSSHDCTDR